MVRFVGRFEPVTLAASGAIARTTLPNSTSCRTGDGRDCVILGRETVDPNGPFVYNVEYSTGLRAKLSEVELMPSSIPLPSSPIEALESLRHGGYGLFSSRDEFRKEYQALLRRGGGVRALLSSRIDLRPHQAYVAGSVILDPRQRYLLADEVGLGKTIEAGIVIHDLLCKKADANILVLCPGSLVQQWLAELYAKFCGHVFTVPELSGGAWASPAQVILSLARSSSLSERLMAERWDLVVIDETHHLLRDSSLYRLASSLAKGCSRLLLLSALPAQHREEEYLRLLALLEPERYGNGAGMKAGDFRELYARQVEIGRKLGYVSRRLLEVRIDPSNRDRVIAKMAELRAMPVLSADGKLEELSRQLEGEDDVGLFEAKARELVHYVGDAYRINRRIFRNRRSRLIELQQIEPIKRALTRIEYRPDQFEMDAEAAIISLLGEMRKVNGNSLALSNLARQLLQSLCWPSGVAKGLSMSNVEPDGDQAVPNLDAVIGYDEWDQFISAQWKSLKQSEGIRNALRFAIRTVDAWRANEAESLRIKALTDLLKAKKKSAAKAKVIIFAGFPGVARVLADVLATIFGPEAIARFHDGLAPDPTRNNLVKEDEVRRFRRNAETWILISDETGGEGRNFQFIDEIIFFDLPWQPSKIEQRIGRLDRLGRAQGVVNTNVVFCSESVEAALVECYEAGFGVFSRSISGLEFALRELEIRMTEVASTDGAEGLRALPPEIRELADKERAEDEAQEMLDAASCERSRADRFLKSQSNPNQDKRLEAAFKRYIRSVSQKDGASFIRDAWGAEDVIRFRPSAIQELSLKLRTGANGVPPEHTGTFRRALAQERPDLQFFSVGNDFFDAVCESLNTCVAGRSYAIECKTQAKAWRGFEFNYTVVAKAGPIAGPASDMVHLSGLYVKVLVSDQGGVMADDTWLEHLKKELTPENKGRTWHNLSKERAQALGAFYAEAGWPALIRKLEAIGREEAKSRMLKLVSPRVLEESERLDNEIGALERAKPDNWKETRDSLIQAKAQLSEWSLMLDSSGFISVNGAIGERDAGG